jgi:hypothetical protein
MIFSAANQKGTVRQPEGRRRRAPLQAPCHEVGAQAFDAAQSHRRSSKSTRGRGRTLPASRGPRGIWLQTIQKEIEEKLIIPRSANAIEQTSLPKDAEL